MYGTIILWMCRSSLQSSIVAQKLGLFHNQNFSRKEVKPLSSYIGDTGQVESLLSYRAPPGSHASRPEIGSLSDFQDTFKNARPTWSLKPTGAATAASQLEVANRQIGSIAAADNRAHKQRLFALWQSRGENEAYTEDLLRYFKARARLLHYVFTPLLFLPLWRWKANATRDQNAAGDSLGAASPAACGGVQKRSRHDSGSKGEVTASKPRRSHSVSSQSAGSLPGVAAQSPPAQKAGADQYHVDLVAHFIQENVQYMQTLGFQVIVFSAAFSQAARRPAVPRPTAEAQQRVRKMTGSGGIAPPAASKSRARPQVVYLQKSLLGGILIFEIGVSEPFFYCKLHAIEAQRLQPRSRQNLPNKNFTTTFLEECDKIKILIHLHSFTYDYHLRTLSSYVSQRPGVSLREGFHVVSFLEDFLKYYSKGPNFARNFIYSGALHVISQVLSFSC